MSDKTPSEETLSKPAAVQAQKLEALGRFAGGIAHDFNNILSIIEGYTNIAVKSLQDGTLTPQQLQKILLSTQRGAGLTRQLLAFSSQKIGFEQTIDLCAAMETQRVLLRPLLGETIEFALLLPPHPVWIEAADDQITQIILNLALNARDAMPDGGKLMILCQSKAGQAEITVSDTGAGIPAHLLPHIFDPFFTTKPQDKGTGLGLSVVYGIVEQMKGKISVASSARTGTTFTVSLPLAVAPFPDMVSPSASPAMSLKGKTVLVAEDEPELRDILGVMLSSFDMRVLRASNGNHAMDIQQDYGGKIDFLLTDVVMPEMDGIRLGKLFGAERPDTNVIYMSGYPLREGGGALDVPKTAAFISKPMQEETVRQVLERALERQKEREQNQQPPADPAP